MTSETTASTRDEMPVFFDTGDQAIFGIVTRPTIVPLGVVMIVLSGGGIPISTNRNRLSVRLCRRAADLGFHALRFDYHGVGESEGYASTFRLDQPFTADLMDAVAWARRSGFERVVLVGSCFGARTALAASPLIHELAGAVLVSAPVRDMEMGDRIATGLATDLSAKDFVRRAMKRKVVRGLFDPNVRRTYRRVAAVKVGAITVGRSNGNGHEDEATRGFVDQMAALTGRHVPLLLIYGADEDLLRAFERARSGRLGRVLADASPTIELATLPGTVHGFTSLTVQEQVLDSVTGWLSRLAENSQASAG